MKTRLIRLTFAFGLASLSTVALPGAVGQSPASRLELTVLSGRADMITGGNALIRVSGPEIVTVEITIKNYRSNSTT